jgi:eukaryotic-like serine/threonine-protein kinase
MRDPERDRQIERLVNEALSLATEARAAFLAEICAGDAELRREVDVVLARSDQTRTLLASQQPALEVPDSLVHPSPLEGRVISRYRILTHLGKGGMGEVWLAQDTMLDRKVALKFLRQLFTGDPDRLQRFFREAKAASALNHPNIITIYEIGQADGINFITTEFIEGVTMRARLNEGRPDLAETLWLIQQVAAALETAHKAGIVHRDVKPENIMVRPDGLVKVLDFGLARISEGGHGRFGPDTPPGARAHHEPRTLLGTISYMSPEQARGLDVDARSDIFSLGIVLYEMVSGHLPFPGKTPTDKIVAIVDRPPLPLAGYAPDAPPELEQIIGRALEKDPAARYAAVREMAADLHRLGAALGSPVPGGSGLSLLDLEIAAGCSSGAGSGAASPAQSGRSRWHGRTVGNRPGSLPLVRLAPGFSG